MNKIEKFKRKIAAYDELSFNEAKELFELFNNITDDKLKNQYLEKIVLGTLYVVCDYIESNQELFSSICCDLDDFISSFCEEWIVSIKNGSVFNRSCFGNMFTKSFFLRVSKNMSPNFSVAQQYGIDRASFVTLFKKYLELNRLNDKASLEDLVGEDASRINKYLIVLFDKIYERNDLFKEDLPIDDSKLLGFVDTFIDSGICDKLNNNTLEEDDCIDSAIDSIFYSSFRNDIDEMQLPDNYRKFIEKRFGFDGECRTLVDIAEELNFSIAEVKKIEEKSLKKLRFCKSVKNFNRKKEF